MVVGIERIGLCLRERTRLSLCKGNETEIAEGGGGVGHDQARDRTDGIRNRREEQRQSGCGSRDCKRSKHYGDSFSESCYNLVLKARLQPQRATRNLHNFLSALSGDIREHQRLLSQSRRPFLVVVRA